MNKFCSNLSFRRAIRSSVNSYSVLEYKLEYTVCVTQCCQCVEIQEKNLLLACTVHVPLLSVSVPLHHFAFVFLFDGMFTPDSFHFLCALVSALPSILFYKLYCQKCSCSLFEDAFLLLPLAEQAILEPKFPASSFAIESRELATSVCALRVGSVFSDVHISGCFCEIKQGLGRHRHLVVTVGRNYLTSCRPD